MTLITSSLVEEVSAMMNQWLACSAASQDFVRPVESQEHGQSNFVDPVASQEHDQSKEAGHGEKGLD